MNFHGQNSVGKTYNKDRPLVISVIRSIAKKYTCIQIKKLTDILKNETENMRKKKDSVKKQQVDFFRGLELLEVKILVIDIKNSLVSYISD